MSDGNPPRKEDEMRSSSKKMFLCVLSTLMLCGFGGNSRLCQRRNKRDGRKDRAAASTIVDGCDGLGYYPWTRQ